MLFSAGAVLQPDSDTVLSVDCNRHSNDPLCHSDQHLHSRVLSTLLPKSNTLLNVYNVTPTEGKPLSSNDSPRKRQDRQEHLGTTDVVVELVDLRRKQVRQVSLRHHDAISERDYDNSVISAVVHASETPAGEACILQADGTVRVWQIDEQELDHAGKQNLGRPLLSQRLHPIYHPSFIDLAHTRTRYYVPC